VEARQLAAVRLLDERDARIRFACLAQLLCSTDCASNTEAHQCAELVDHDLQ
jgi:hypothetical protein